MRQIALPGAAGTDVLRRLADHAGGSARSYQKLLAPSAIPTTAEQAAGKPYVYPPPMLGVIAREPQLVRDFAGRILT
jgi:hypothetical protein